MHSPTQAILARIGLITVFLGVILVQTARAELILSAPPRESKEDGIKTYGPLAEYLSKITGEKVEYRYPPNWRHYQAMMTKGEYDLVFDGPHFVSWRIARQQHVPLAALAGNLSFVIVAHQDNKNVRQMKDLIGKPVCGLAPPNLATLTLFDQFPNPSRQPTLLETKGFDISHKSLLAGTCVGTVFPVEIFKTLGFATQTKILYTSKLYANQALTAGPRVSVGTRQKIAQALLGTEGKPGSRQIAAGLGGNEFVAAQKEDYIGYDELLKNSWGF